MRSELQIRLVERVLAHLAAKTTDTLDRVGHAEASSYHAEDALARERSALFRRLPMCVAHGSEIARPGDHLVREVDGVSVLFVRGDDGEARAFLNVCRHRGAQLVNEESGCGAKSFACPYHRWTYGRDGKLLGVPHSPGFEGIERQGLVALPTSEIAGLLFVRLTPGEASATPDGFGPIAEDLEGWGFGSHVVDARRTFERPINWKLNVDIFLEAYHVRPTHETTIYPLFFDNVAVVDAIGPHTRNLFPKRTIGSLASVPREEWRLRAHSNVLYHFFPNTLMLVQPDHAAVFHAYPLAPDRTRLLAYTLIPEPAATEKARTYWDKNNAILFGAIEEDFAMGASIQRGLTSGANSRFTFGRYEHALTHFHEEVRRRASTDEAP